MFIPIYSILVFSFRVYNISRPSQNRFIRIFHQILNIYIHVIGIYGNKSTCSFMLISATPKKIVS